MIIACKNERTMTLMCKSFGAHNSMQCAAWNVKMRQQKQLRTKSTTTTTTTTTIINEFNSINSVNVVYCYRMNIVMCVLGLCFDRKFGRYFQLEYITHSIMFVVLCKRQTSYKQKSKWFAISKMNINFIYYAYYS